tara:strand:- start:787 stop:1080 length:294 start_codon:yes stop_codon:yes gene_type:complete
MRINFIFLLFLLTTCSSFDEAGKALRNEKTRTTDEFLIEKRGPLSLPPKMNELPKPRTNNSEVKKDNESILDTAKGDGKSEEKSELENIFIEEIRKN